MNYRGLADPTERRIPILSLTLLRNLIQRLCSVSPSAKDGGVWFPVVHSHVLVQALLSRVHHSLRRNADADLIQTTLGLLIAITKYEL